jgi:HEAT repeat protein
LLFSFDSCHAKADIYLILTVLKSIIGHSYDSQSGQEPPANMSQLLSDISSKYFSPTVKGEAMLNLVSVQPEKLISHVFTYLNDILARDQEKLADLVEPHIEKLLNTDANKSERTKATTALRNIGFPSPKVLDTLVKASGPSNPYEIRVEALIALGELKTPTDEVLQALFTALKDDDHTIWPLAAHAFQYLGCKDEKIVDALIEALKKHESAKSTLIPILGSVGVGSEKACKALIPIVLNGNSISRYTALRALGNIGLRNEEVLAVLNQIYDSGEEDFKMIAAVALGKLGEEKVIPELFQLLSFQAESAIRFKGAEEVRRDAGRALHMLCQIIEDRQIKENSTL